jgi:predicted nucleic acid-binding protein
MIHLDTSFLIRALRTATPEAALLDRWFASGEPVAIGSICWCEFMCGSVDAPTIDLALRTLSSPQAFTVDDAQQAASFFNATGRRRGSLIDCMIAAVALRSGARIATANAADFLRFQLFGLMLATP